MFVAGSDEIPNPEGRRTLQQAVIAQIDHGWTDRVATRFVVPLRDIESENLDFDDAGPGDVEGWARVSLGVPLTLWRTVVSGGLAAPTGEDADPETVSQNILFGAGAVSALASVETSRAVGDGGVIFGLAQYRAPLDEGDEAYRLGDNLGWSVAWQYTGSGGEGRASFMVGLSGQHLGQDELEGQKFDNRGGRLNHLSGGVTVRFGERQQVGGFAQYLLDHDMRGRQLLAEWNLGVMYGFGWGGRE